MDSLPGASALVRGLLVLARSGRSGVLTVQSERVTARVGVRDGRVAALTVDPDDGDAIGDALRRMGAWDETAAAASAPPTGDEPFGLWAARVGVTDPAALSHALRTQMRRRMARLFAEDVPHLRLTAGSPELGVPALSEPPTTSDLLLSAVRTRMAEVDVYTVRRKLGSGLLVLSPLGEELVEGATALWPDEHAVVTMLRRGAAVDALISAAGGSVRAQRTLHGLRLIGACAPPASRRGGYALLLRKKRELDQRARARDLLELPPSASPRETKRALRRLARRLHPDRFGTDPSAAIQEASHSVMSALHAAEGRR